MFILEKVNQAKSILKEFQIDCWITFARESQINGDPILDFFLGSPVTWHSAFVITASGETHAIVGEYDKKTVEDTRAYDRVTGYVKDMKEPFLSCMKKLNPSRIAVNFSKDSEICDGIPHGLFLTLYEFLSEIGFEDRIVSAERLVSALRERKTPGEIACIREAIREAEKIFQKARAFIQPGKTEKEIAEFMKREAERAKLELAWEEAICPAVFTGPETAGAHYKPTERRVEEGHLLNMDFGVRWKGYCSDLQRTYYVLRKGETSPPGSVQEGFKTIVDAIELSGRALKPGVRGHEVDAVARRHVTARGYEEFPHGLGHQVGRFSHDGTALLGPPWEKYAQKPFQSIEEGMVFTIEPRLRVPGHGIVTIEEMVLVTQRGCSYLSTPQRELFLIKPQL